LTDLERPLLAGEQVEFLLRFQHARPLSVVAPVRALR
jgi:copper(I)-binding protein